MTGEAPRFLAHPRPLISGWMPDATAPDCLVLQRRLGHQILGGAVKPKSSGTFDAVRQFWQVNYVFAVRAAVVLAAALAPATVLGQSVTSPLVVTFQDGEWSKAIAASRQYAAPVYIRIGLPDMICGIHTSDEVRARIDALVTDGTLQAKFDALEQAGTASNSALASAFGTFMGTPPGTFTSRYQTEFAGPVAGNYALLAANYSNVLAGTPFEFKWENCLTYADATAWVLEWRKVLRAFLGLSPPAN